MIEIDGQVYDGVNDKPPLDEYIEHLDHKYISKHKGKNGKWIYKYKSKAQELGAKINRKINGVTLPGSVTDNYGRNFKRVYVGDRIEDGNIISSRSGRAGSRKIATTKISSKVSRKPKKKGNLTSRGYSSSASGSQSKKQVETTKINRNKAKLVREANFVTRKRKKKILNGIGKGVIKSHAYTVIIPPRKK